MINKIKKKNFLRFDRIVEKCIDVYFVFGYFIG